MSGCEVGIYGVTRNLLHSQDTLSVSILLVLVGDLVRAPCPSVLGHIHGFLLVALVFGPQELSIQVFLGPAVTHGLVVLELVTGHAAGGGTFVVHT